jgi:EAL domain-containing protein (putative c-di-GMP-specific phosphodiesterase class I)
MTIKIINEMKEMGLKIALDDFGTGYSSLNYLRKFPLDYLKIDKSFIDNLTQDKGTDAVADAIVSIAHKLGMQAIAEGVETVEQLGFLDKIGCDFIQGYYFYRPMPAAEIEALIKPAEGDY